MLKGYIMTNYILFLQSSDKKFVSEGGKTITGMAPDSKA